MAFVYQICVVLFERWGSSLYETISKRVYAAATRVFRIHIFQCEREILSDPTFYVIPRGGGIYSKHCFSSVTVYITDILIFTICSGIFTSEWKSSTMSQHCLGNVMVCDMFRPILTHLLLAQQVSG
ncbi:Hypothetical predicted protein [Podarcis lilfordi]|uniref:Uncharacterized protein n=1 Tax=Podarcis lilfordi TaxID=74358 RepID=A0AA35P2P3_9SAUR|nr:Hypothetical predicted protein [Podarcis lilfordi]